MKSKKIVHMEALTDAETQLINFSAKSWQWVLHPTTRKKTSLPKPQHCQLQYHPQKNHPPVHSMLSRQIQAGIGRGRSVIILAATSRKFSFSPARYAEDDAGKDLEAPPFPPAPVDAEGSKTPPSAAIDL